MLVPGSGSVEEDDDEDDDEVDAADVAVPVTPAVALVEPAPPDVVAVDEVLPPEPEAAEVSPGTPGPQPAVTSRRARSGGETRIVRG